jgi:N-methylhydantoinase A
LHADLRYDRVATWFAKLKDVSFDQLRDIWAELIEQGREALSASQVPVRDVEITYLADMRYVGQEHSVTLEVADDVLSSGDRDLLKQLFDAVHERRYGTCAPQEPAEITALRATVIGVMRRPALASAGTKAGPDPRAAERTKRPVYFRESSGFVEVPVYDRGRLRYGNVISGPALVEEHASTTVLFSGDRLEVDTLGNLVIDVGHAQC